MHTLGDTFIRPWWGLIDLDSFGLGFLMIFHQQGALNNFMGVSSSYESLDDSPMVI